jgi:amino acid adenylation domain-containing protein
MPRGVNVIVSILAVLKAGAAYVPIDVDYPADRIDFILEDTKASIVLTETAFEYLFENNAAIQSVYVDDLNVTQLAPIEATLHVAGTDVICVAYTSGSTGKPKGVQLTHTGISNRLQWMWQHYPFEQGEKNSIKTSIGFVDHIWEIFGPLGKGIPSVVISKEELIDPDVLVNRLREESISRIVLVPSLLKAIVSKLKNDGETLPALKYWSCSGEALPISLVADFYSVFTPEKHKLLNIYGSSEVSADVTCYDTSLHYHWRQPNSSLQYAPIGTPLSNTQVYILDKQGNLTLNGVVGEICIGGVPVTKGYLNLPDLTTARFLQDTFGEGVMFKTGDFGRRLEDCVIENHGRF